MQMKRYCAFCRALNKGLQYEEKGVADKGHTLLAADVKKESKLLS